MSQQRRPREEILRTAQENPSPHQGRLHRQDGERPGHPPRSSSPRTRRSRRTAPSPPSSAMSDQHAREWITPEMTRRLMHHYLDKYDEDRRTSEAGRLNRTVVPPARPTPTATTTSLEDTATTAWAQEPARQHR
ncbi:hypothetical protein LV779_32940 [Streptomyces thinghirensis]|nr:hypothetical protein [Streptomyces thinghirensis]